MRPIVLLSLALTTSLPARAFVYGGNPDLGFVVDRPEGDLDSAVVDLDKVRVFRCDDTWTDYPVDQTVDLVQGVTLTVAGGDLCAATLFWSSEMTIARDEAFVLSYDANTTTVGLEPADGPVPLTPFTLETGFVYGGNPDIDVVTE